ncbi:exoribonuclease II [Malassezia psittaci]|uniref:Exoribonuclease II n=1 Tax=Malassezia psittaci TaxID=1821823 RepID=A0AAF0FA19_9BASI|nr:exoribonuclease II [Malassezia psittaci]
MSVRQWRRMHMLRQSPYFSINVRSRCMAMSAASLRQEQRGRSVRSAQSNSTESKDPEPTARRPSRRPPLELPERNRSVGKKENYLSPEDMKYNVSIGASASKIQEIQPGDFVEVRRTGRTFSGVVLPIPEEHDLSGSGAGTSLAVVLISGVMELVRSTDVMLQFPEFVSKNLAAQAAPLKRDYVAASTARMSATPLALPKTDAVSHEDTVALRQSASSENFLMEQEPLDLPRFEKRASIIRKIRLMQRDTDLELQRIFPAFRALFLQDQIESELNSSQLRNRNRNEDRYLRRALDLLRRGSFTNIEATQLLTQYLAMSSDKEVKSEQNFSGETVFAMHTLFMNYPKQFLVDSTTHRHSQMFTYRSMHEQKILDRVSTWDRNCRTIECPGGSSGTASKEDNLELTEAMEILDGFCSRARAAIKWKEQKTIRTVQQDLAYQHGQNIQWTNTDKEIIQFLKISVGNRRELQEDPTGSVAMSIIKRVGAHVHLAPIVHPSMELLKPPYAESPVAPRPKTLSDTNTSVTTAGTDLQHALVYNFLIRIGSLTPWEDPNALDTYLKNIEDNANQTAEASNEKRYSLSLNHEEEQRRLRFKNLPVFVIDSANAHELDDGISLDKQGDGTYWVHVHIADPTARIPQDHPLALEAQQKYSSIYFPQAQWPLFPAFAVYNGMSLTDSKSSREEKQQVMTFSAHLDRDGRVLDYAVRPALIQNVHTVSYDEVNELFSSGHTNLQPDSVFRSEECRDQIKTLADLAGKLNSRRIGIGKGVNASSQASDVFVSPLPLPSLAAATPDGPRYYGGFPNITVTATDPLTPLRSGTFDGLPGGISAENMVSEMMLLAGRVAANFSARNNIVMPYRLQDPPDAEQVAVIDKLKNPVTGALPVMELQKRDIFLSPAYFSAVPGRHYGLGIGVAQLDNTDPSVFHGGGYVRVTSPLRRYADLLSHYQLKASLLGKKSLRPEELVFQFPRFERMESWVKQIERSSQRFWLWTYVDRVLTRFREAGDEPGRLQNEFGSLAKELVKPMKAFVGVPDVRLSYDTLQAKIRVNLMCLGGYPADCIWEPSRPAPPRGTILDIVIKETISAGSKRTIVCDTA